MKYKNSLKTRKTIKRVYSELIHEKKDIKKITVKEIVERAGISKSTFYTHYGNIYDVSIDFESEILSVVENLLNEYSNNNRVGFVEYFNKLLNIMKENEELYKNILTAEIPGQFIEKLKEILKQAILKDNYTKTLSTDLNKKQIQATFLANGLIYMLVDYFKGEMGLTIDELNDAVISLIR